MILKMEPLTGILLPVWWTMMICVKAKKVSIRPTSFRTELMRPPILRSRIASGDCDKVSRIVMPDRQRKRHSPCGLSPKT